MDNPYLNNLRQAENVETKRNGKALKQLSFMDFLQRPSARAIEPAVGFDCREFCNGEDSPS